MISELDEKTDRITAMLTREGLDAVLLNAQHNFAWFTGGGCNGVDLSRENGIATLMVTRDGKRFLLASRIEIERICAEEIFDSDVQQIEYSWQDEKASGRSVLAKARSLLTADSRIGSDIIDGSIPVESKIARCRQTLVPAEIERYRELGRDAGHAVRRAIDRLEPGETELQIAEKLRHDLGLQNIASVVTLVAADERIRKFRHPIPTSNRWRKTLLIVTCARRNGLITSLSRMICVGSVPDDLKKRTDACAFVNAKMLNECRPGVSGADIYQVAAAAYAERGFADEIDLHHQGGATGYRTREWVAHPNSDDVVYGDQAFAWNPSITGTKVEETCIVAKDGIEIITASPEFPYISTVVDGREYFSPGIFTI